MSAVAAIQTGLDETLHPEHSDFLHPQNRRTLQHERKEFTVTRRKLLVNGKCVGSMLLAGFIGGIPWRVFDSFKKRQDTPEPVRLPVAGSLTDHASISTITINKIAGPTGHPPA